MEKKQNKQKKNNTPTLLRGSLKKKTKNKHTNKNTLLWVKTTAEEVAALATSRQQRELRGGAR